LGPTCDPRDFTFDDPFGSKCVDTLLRVGKLAPLFHEPRAQPQHTTQLLRREVHGGRHRITKPLAKALVTAFRLSKRGALGRANPPVHGGPTAFGHSFATSDRSRPATPSATSRTSSSPPTPIASKADRAI